MVQVRLLAPWNNSKGEPQAAGAVINVSDEEAQDLGNRGMISRLDEEKKLEDQQHTSGVYGERATREGTAPLAGQQAQEAQAREQQQPGAAAPNQANQPRTQQSGGLQASASDQRRK